MPVDDWIADEEAKAILRDKLMSFGEQLRGKKAVIFDERLRSDNSMTLHEIGAKFGISRERVRQLEARSKKQLKTYLEEELEDIDLLQKSMTAV